MLCEGLPCLRAFSFPICKVESAKLYNREEGMELTMMEYINPVNLRQFNAPTRGGCRGIVSALSVNPEGILAAGSFLREIGLYEHHGSGECTTTFSLAPASGEVDVAKGAGITQLAWSPCGTYLLVAERQSDIIQVFDMRNTIGRVSWLSSQPGRASCPESAIPMSWEAGGCGKRSSWRCPC